MFPLQGVVRLFGQEVLKLWTAVLLKKRVVVYCPVLQDLLRLMRSIPQLAWHRHVRLLAMCYPIHNHPVPLPVVLESMSNHVWHFCCFSAANDAASLSPSAPHACVGRHTSSIIVTMVLCHANVRL